MLKDGFNPVYQKTDSYINNHFKTKELKDVGMNNIWIDHYPKASWLFSACIYSLTNNIESSKIITVLVMYIAFGIFINYLYKKTNIIFSTLISLLICINPVSIVQVFTFYVDGLLGLCLYIILYALVALSDKDIIKDKEGIFFEKQNWLILAVAIMICINLKFTGLVYSGIFCIMFFVLWVYMAYKEKTLKDKLTKYILYYVIVVMISVMVVGFSPYVKNMVYKSNPLYPLIGKDKIDIITYNEPKSFIEKGRGR